MSKFVSSSEPFEYHPQMESMAMKERWPTKAPGWRFVSLIESQNRARESLASSLEEAGRSVNELLEKVIFRQMQNSGVPTHDSTNTTQVHPTMNQRFLPALGYYVDADRPRKRVFCSEGDEDAGSLQKRVRCDEPGQDADGHRECANYSGGDEDAGNHRKHVRCGQGDERGKEAGSYHGVCYHRDDAADHGGANKADSYGTRGEHKADRPDGFDKNRGGHSGTQARSRDGSGYWRSTDARADRDSGHRGGTHAYRHTSTERRSEVYIDRREWVRSRNTKDAYVGDDRNSRHGGSKSHQRLKNSRFHDPRSGESKRGDHSRNYDSDRSTRKNDRWHEGFSPPPPPPPLPRRQAFPRNQPRSNRQSGRQRDTDWIPRDCWHTIGKKTQEMVRKHGRSERQRRRRGKGQRGRREAEATSAVVEGGHHADVSTGSTSRSVHRRRNDDRRRGDVDGSEVEHRRDPEYYNDHEFSDEVPDYGGDE